jgi:putative ABC transport system substrate-binding protein
MVPTLETAYAFRFWYAWGISLMRRRKFIALVAGAVAWPLAVRAQQAEQMRRIGILMSIGESDPLSGMHMKSFQEGLRELGWVEGRNVRFDNRWAEGDADRYRTYAAELVSLGPDVILTSSTPAARAQQQASRRIPIVFVSISDPVGDGFVASLATPGGNMTGFSNYDPAMVGKWLELLKEIAPNTKKVAVVYNPDTAPHSIFLPPLKDAMQAFAMQMAPTLVRSVGEIESAIAALGREPAAGLLAIPDGYTYVHRALLTTQAAKHRVPTVYPFSVFAKGGGLVSYGVEIDEQFRRAASYVDRILRGAKPSDLPVQAPTKFELVINLKTAKALGLTIPPALLARADEVIE